MASVLVGGALFGVYGAILGVPFIAVIIKVTRYKVASNPNVDFLKNEL